MKLSTCVICILAIISTHNSNISAQSVTDQFEKRIHSAYGKTIPYRLFIPADYDPASDYPLILTLHGSGERGTDNGIQITTFRIAEVWAEDTTQQKYPCFVVSPQCPSNQIWYSQFEVISDLIMSLREEFSIDSSRLYMTGFSMGAIGNWYALSMIPLRFAAIVPVAGNGFPEIMPLLDYFPAIWNFHAMNDGVVDVSGSRNMIHAVEAALGMDAVYPELRDGEDAGLTESGLDSVLQEGTTLLYTEYASGDHISRVDHTYNNPKMHKWLFAQSTEFIVRQSQNTPKTNEKSELYLMGDGPVLSPATTGSWEDFAVSEPAVIQDGDTLKMWYVGWHRSQTKIGYAWSLDGISWTRHNQNPVLSASFAWEEGTLLQPVVIKDGAIYKMWYSAGYQRYFSTAIGYATSTDGISWNKNSDAVLLPGESTEWDYFNIGLGSVLKEEDGYKMWYHGGTWPTGLRVGMATSVDGINWLKYDDDSTSEHPYQDSDPVLHKGQFMEDWDFFTVWYPIVLAHPEGYQMWYSATNIGHEGFICYAISVDGINWSKSESNPILVDPPQWSSRRSGYIGGSIVNSNSYYRYWYSLYDPVTGNIDIAYATDFSNIVHSDSIRLSRSFLSPGIDTLILESWINNQANHRLEVQTQINSIDDDISISLDLNDSGLDYDLLAGDGIWTAGWPVPDYEKYYKLELSTSDLDTGTVFYHPLKTRFTSIGPIAMAEKPIANNIYDAPLRMQAFNLVLKNDGASIAAEDLTVKISSSDPRVEQGNEYFTLFPDLTAGETDTSSIFDFSYFFYADEYNPDSTINNPIQFDVVVYSDNYPFWTDSFDFEATITGIADKHSSNILTKFSLSQNYPNPFNPKTMINYQLAMNSDVELSIYNILGQKVVTLVDKKQAAGSYKVEWDATDFSTGVYLYRLSAGDFAQTRKLVVLK